MRLQPKPATHHQPVSRALLPLRVRCSSARYYPGPMARYPLGVSPLQGSPSPSRRSCFQDPPLSSFLVTRTGRNTIAPQGLTEPGARLVSRETADPPEVCDLVEPLTRSSLHRTGLIVSPRSRPLVTVGPALLFGPCSNPTGAK